MHNHVVSLSVVPADFFLHSLPDSALHVDSTYTALY